jgi:hypothetical protein
LLWNTKRSFQLKTAQAEELRMSIFMPLLLNIGIKDVAREFNFDQSNARAAMAAIKAFVIEMLLSGGVSVLIRRPSRTRAQREKAHSLIGEISKQVSVYGKKFELQIWKAKLVDQFEKDLIGMGDWLEHPSRVTSSIDGERMVSLRASTEDFNRKEYSQFIEFIYAQGVEMGVKWPLEREREVAAEREYLAQLMQKKGATE